MKETAKRIEIKRALISVSDKSGLIEFARALMEFGVEIISTGGTLAVLKKEGIHAISVSAFTGAPEILGGRVKTLHPKVYAGILYRRDNQADEDQLAQQEYKRIDMVVVNLYPFEKTVANPDATDEEIIENIDIGGPTMLRAAAKNFDGVAVITDPADYNSVIEKMRASKGTLDLDYRKELAGKVFNVTKKYDQAISAYFSNVRTQSSGEFPENLNYSFRLKSSMRYGENPHQSASFYCDETFTGPTLANGRQLAGKELSYNNIGDLDACLEMLLDFTEPFACVLKHANPCGAAVGETIADAYRDALASDPLSAFGSIIGLNKQVDMAAAKLLHDTFFVECILAPGFDEDALALLKKKSTRRLLVLPDILKGRPKGEKVFKYVRGGLLLQKT